MRAVAHEAVTDGDWEHLAGLANGLGPALVWADHHRARDIEILLDRHAANGGLLARQAGYFTEPNVVVWQAGAGGPTRVPPAPLPEPRKAPPATELVDVLIDAGTEVVVEDGIVRGEVNGLEVARIVYGQTTAGVPVDGPLLEVGVGAADRELTAMLHGELSPGQQLERAVTVVRRLRHAHGPHHPLSRLAPERWLRAVLCRSPSAIGLAALRPAEGPRPRTNLRERAIAVARGTTAANGREVVVVCSVGIDLELVPAAADARAFLDPAAELWLVVPERDDHPTTRRLASQLRRPAEVVLVTDSWRTGI